MYSKAALLGACIIFKVFFSKTHNKIKLKGIDTFDLVI